MKHLISLALKYIRRQKARSILTFLCITLSVFILSTFSAYFGSILQTLKNFEIHNFGSWEADITKWVNQAPDSEKAIDIVANHSAVSDYYASENEDLVFDTSVAESDGKIRYITFGTENGSKRVKYLYSHTYKGNPELEIEPFSSVSSSKSGFFVSDWVKNFGFSEGDTLTFTLNYAQGRYDEDSAVMKNVRKKLLETYGTSVVRDDPEYSELSEDERKKANKMAMSSILSQYGIHFDDVPLKNIEYGTECTYSFKIAGFLNSSDEVFLIQNHNGEKISMADFQRLNPDVPYQSGNSVSIRLDDKIDFDDGLEMLFRDLGYDPAYYYDYEPLLNDYLLGLEFKSASKISALLPVLLLGGILIFIAWAIARFVIDNAFEMCVQERSSQYATLRVMGASKAQVATLVFTEASFYCITAVPIGAVSAYLICRSVMRSIKNLGFTDFEFKANAVIAALGIVLCILAIFISAYTSAMWASRKLSPAEAMNFGKPRRKEKKMHHRKSKLRLSSKKFIRRYTKKNIGRTKSRFIISTVTMSLGVLMFTFSLLIGIYAYITINRGITGENDYDFMVDCEYDCYEDVEKLLGDEEIFSDVRIFSNTLEPFNAESAELLNSLMPYDEYRQSPKGTYVHIYVLNRNIYEKDIAEITKISYDDFVKSKKAVLSVSAYGKSTDRELVYDKNKDKEVYAVKYDTSYTPLDGDYTIVPEFEGAVHPNIELLGVLCSNTDETCIILPLENAGYYNIYQITVTAAVKDTQSYEAAENIMLNFVQNYETYFYANNYMFNTGLSTFIKTIIKTVLVFLVSIWLVGILSMINSVNTSVLNRSREMMMLRSVGMNRKQLRNTIFLESFMFSSVSAVSGTAVGVMIYLLFMRYAAGAFAPFMLWSIVAVVPTAIIVNIIIAVLSSIPALKSLERAESIAQAL